MKTIKFEKIGRKEYIYLDGEKYRAVPNSNKLVEGSVYFQHKGKLYVRE